MRKIKNKSEPQWKGEKKQGHSVERPRMKKHAKG